ncbi:MAG: DUF4411 family protein [Planctomycetaceae bacterium]
MDANVFVEAHRRYYGFGICPGFWLALTRHHEDRRVCSIDKIKNELGELNDALQAWAVRKAPATFFKRTADRRVIDAFGQMVNWVQNEQQFTAEAKADFASVADGWVIAYAKANGLVVVTHEEFSPDAKKRVLMPNVCVEFGVDYCDTFKMLSDLKVKFVLKKHR